MLPGKKSYIVAALMALYAIAGLVGGLMGAEAIAMPPGDAFKLLMEAAAIAGIRAGISKAISPGGLRNVLVPFVMVGLVFVAVGCNKSDVDKVVDGWSTVSAFIPPAVEVAAGWCETHEELSGCVALVEVKDDGLAAFVKLNELVGKVAAVASYWTKDDRPTQDDRVAAYERAFETMSPEMVEEFRLALRRYENKRLDDRQYSDSPLPVDYVRVE